LSEEATCQGKEGVCHRREEGVCRRKAFAAGGRRPFIDLRIGPLVDVVGRKNKGIFTLSQNSTCHLMSEFQWT